MSAETYEDTANELSRRILTLIPKYPEILTMESPRDLFKIKEFFCKDLAPTMFQAGWALAKARKDYSKDQV